MEDGHDPRSVLPQKRAMVAVKAFEIGYFGVY